MKVVDLVCSKGLAGFYYDDRQAIKAGAEDDGMFYNYDGQLSPGFSKVRMEGESISVTLVLENGQIGLGDYVSVQYSGAVGRDSLFLADEHMEIIQGPVRDFLLDRRLGDFKTLAQEIDQLEVGGKRLHSALRYGLTGAALDGVAVNQGRTRAEVMRDEYKTGLEIDRVPILAQSGDDRYINCDKMIIKKVDSLPHGLFNNLKHKTGLDGGKLIDYVKWVRDRILEKRDDYSYQPIIHLDVYGTIGEFTGHDLSYMLKYFKVLEENAYPFKLRIEGPVDMGSKDGQIEMMKDLTKAIDDKEMGVELVADDWCNSLEDIIEFAQAKAGHMIQLKAPELGGINNTVLGVLSCREAGVKAYCGGSCNESSVSVQIVTDIAMATGADLILARPEMGVDEGLMVVSNQMNRVMALINARV